MWAMQETHFFLCRTAMHHYDLGMVFAYFVLLKEKKKADLVKQEAS